MDKYRILSKNNGSVLLQSETGKIVRVNEGVFRDTFVKLKDLVISYVKKGGEILTKIGDKISYDVNNIYNILLNKGDDVHVHLSKGLANECSEVGVKNPNSDFENYMEEEEVKDAEGAEQLLIYAIMDLKHLCDSGEVTLDELVSATTVSDKNVNEGITDMFKRVFPGLYGSRVQDDNGNIDPKKIRKADKGGKPGKTRRALWSTDDDIPNLSRDELFEMLDNRAEYIFGSNITKDSYKDFRPGMYKPILIMGESGVGKTAIVKELRNRYAVGGREIQFVDFKGQNITRDSFSSPGKSTTINYARDPETGKILVDDNGEPIAEVETRDALERVMSSEIVSFNWRNAEIHNNVVECDTACGYGILFIDEISRIPQPQFLDLVTQLGKDRQIGNYALGTHWMVVFASNPGEMDEGNRALGAKDVMHKLFNDDAIARRVDMVQFVPTLPEWLEWAKESGVHPLVIKYLSAHDTMFHFFNNVDEVPTVNPRPASTAVLWEELSDLLYSLEKKRDLNNVNEARKFIQSICIEIKAKMPRETADFKNFLDEEYLYLSSDDIKNIWENPEGIKWKKGDGEEGNTGKRKRNEEISGGRGLAMDIDTLANRIYDACPIKITGLSSNSKENKNKGDEFMENIKDYFNNLSEFIDYFYSKNGEIDDRYNGVIKLPKHNPYKQNGNYTTQRKDLIEHITRLFLKDLEDAYGDSRVGFATNTFINGDGIQKYEFRNNISPYFAYLLGSLYNNK